jgi:hypothetical protein
VRRRGGGLRAAYTLSLAACVLLMVVDATMARGP